MDNKKMAKAADIAWGWVAVCFIFGAWPIGIALIILKLMGEQAQEELKRENIRRAQQNLRKSTGETGSGEGLGRAGVYQDVKAKPVKEKTSASGTQWQGSSYRSGGMQSGKTAGGTKAEKNKSGDSPEFDAQYIRSELMKQISPKKGRSLQVIGSVLMGLGGFNSMVQLMRGFLWGNMAGAVMITTVSALALILPGLGCLINGGNKRKKMARCRNHLAMIGNRRTVSLDEMDAASPGNFKTVCKDLEWMLGQGFFPGAYLDMGRRVFTYPGEQESASAEKNKEMFARVTVDANGQKLYAEEQAIRQLDVRIRDEYVSQRIQRLAQLTHQILAYVEANPAKEHKIRQFNNHYLPKTIKILEAYARMEQQNVSGANIRGAMADVEQIMDKLVAGFEKQLDALFDSEAMDVSTDINVLENLMNMEGLGELDPFGGATGSHTRQTK